MEVPPRYLGNGLQDVVGGDEDTLGPVIAVVLDLRLKVMRPAVQVFAEGQPQVVSWYEEALVGVLGVKVKKT